MFSARSILYCALLSVICIGASAGDQDSACPLCGQKTVVEIVYGKPDQKTYEKAEAGAIIMGGCDKKEETHGCSFCHRYIEPFLRIVRQLLAEYPERKFDPAAIYSEQGDLRILKGWRCGDDLNAFVSKEQLEFKPKPGFRCHDIPLLTPTENNFRLYVMHKDEDSEIFEHLRKSLYVKFYGGGYIKDKLYAHEPDWDYIMEVLHCIAAIPESPLSGVSRQGLAFGPVEDYFMHRKRNGLPEERSQYQLTRKRYRDICDLKAAYASPSQVLMIRNRKLQFDAPDFQDPDERKALIRDIRQFLNTEFNAECSRILIRLLADECRSGQDLEAVEKELERFLEKNASRGYSASSLADFVYSILLTACVYDPETAIRWTDMTAGMLLDEDRIASELKYLPEASHAEYRKGIKQVVGNIYSRAYASCWKTGNYDTAERWMSFCGDLNTQCLRANTKEHLKLLKVSKEYFKFVRNDPGSALRQAIACRDVPGMKAILKTTKDEFLRFEAEIRLGKLLLEQGRPKEAMAILHQWELPLSKSNENTDLDLSDILNEMKSRRILLETKSAIALNDVFALENMAFGAYTAPWAGEARRLGMKHLKTSDPERYERGKAYLIRVQEPLSHIILDFEDGLPGKSSQKDQ